MEDKKKRINWKVSNFLISKQGNLIVVNQPNHTDDAEFFSGSIIYADESEINNAPDYSTHYRKNKFERLDKSKVVIKLIK
jgi:hypothetical protein